jgi:hypothetical protein
MAGSNLRQPVSLPTLYLTEEITGQLLKGIDLRNFENRLVQKDGQLV